MTEKYIEQAALEHIKELENEISHLQAHIERLHAKHAARHKGAEEEIAIAQHARDEAHDLLRECRPWVVRGLSDHPAPTEDALALLVRLDAMLGGRDE